MATGNVEDLTAQQGSVEQVNMAEILDIGAIHALLNDVLSGQFFFQDEQVGDELLRAQAQRYGFDETRYLAAIERAPRLSRAEIETGIAFLMNFGRMVAQLDYGNHDRSQTLTERRTLIHSLWASAQHRLDAPEGLRAHIEALPNQQAPLQRLDSINVPETRTLQDAVRERESLFRLLTEAMPAMVYMHKGPYLVYVNPSLEQSLGYTADEMMQRPYLELVHLEDRQRLAEYGRARLEGKEAPGLYEARLLTKTGETRWVQVSPVAAEWHGEPVILGIGLDVTERRKTEEENKKLIRELQDALAQVKTLKGILPICAYCKKIRDDKGYWELVELYITKHTGALFSHGMCPDCYEKASKEFEVP